MFVSAKGLHSRRPAQWRGVDGGGEDVPSGDLTETSQQETCTVKGSGWWW